MSVSRIAECLNAQGGTIYIVTNKPSLLRHEFNWRVTHNVLVSLKFLSCLDALVKQRFQYLYNELTLDVRATTRLLAKVVSVARS